MHQADAKYEQHTLGRWLFSSRAPARVLRLSIVAIGVVAGLAFLRVVLMSLQPPGSFHKDILQEYLMARALADGNSPLLPVQALGDLYLREVPVVLFPHPTPHPPTAGLLLLPLALLDYAAVPAVWLGLELACLATAVALTLRSAGARASVAGTLALTAVLLAWHPVYEELYDGQIMVLILALLAAALLALQSRRAVAAGLLVGLAVLIKPVPWPLLLLFVVRREWGALAGAACTIAAGYAAVAWAIGAGGVVGYLTEILPSVTGAYRVLSANLSVWTLGRRLFQGTEAAVQMGTVTVSRADTAVIGPLLDFPPAAGLASAVAAGMVLLLGLMAARRQARLDAAFGIMLGVSILVTPVAWNHYLVLAIIPLAQITAWLVTHRLPRRETNVAIVLALLLIPPVSEWVKLGHLIAGQPPDAGTAMALPFAAGLVTLAPTAGIAATVWFAAMLGGGETSPHRLSGDRLSVRR